MPKHGGLFRFRISMKQDNLLEKMPIGSASLEFLYNKKHQHCFRPCHTMHCKVLLVDLILRQLASEESLSFVSLCESREDEEGGVDQE
eukprot:scaffold38206_cov150-Skeletonema_dohrnii-CCMP3373.AAC.1